MLAGDINLNQGWITIIDNNNMWDNFYFCNCNLATDWTENQTSFATDISNSGNKWSMLKNKGMHIIR